MEEALNWFLYVSLALFGLAFGSFANVVIWRFPRGESLSQPASHCPVCETPIEWRDNIPVVSWLLLRGRCRTCGTAISARYPTVELLSAVLWVFAGVIFGVSWQTAAAVFFFYVLMLITFIDADIMRIPNALVALLVVVGLACSVAAQLLGVPIVPLVPLGSGVFASPVATSLVGAAVSSGFSLAVALAYSWVRKTRGFGMGDVKLLAAIGVFLGAYGLLALFVGSVMGAVYGMALARREGGSLQTKFPFGPFLAGAAVLVTAFGPTVWGWYAGLFR